MFAAVLPWQFFSTALTEASSSLIGNANLISKVYFPRLIVPFAAVATALVDFVDHAGAAGAADGVVQVAPTMALLALPLFVLLAIVLSFGLGLFLAALNVKYRDFRYVVPFIVQIGLFVSPIAFTTADVPERWRADLCAQPDGRHHRRIPLVDPGRRSRRWRSNRLLATIVISVVVTLVAIWYFRRTERGFADVI